MSQAIDRAQLYWLLGWPAIDSGAPIYEPQLLYATERLSRAGDIASLVEHWIPVLDGVEARLRDGALVADVGSRHVAPLILLAQAFPRSRFVGFDDHADSVRAARRRAEVAGVGDRVRFEVAHAGEFPGRSYDLVTSFDALHDLSDPIEAAAHIRSTLRPDGVWMIVEPRAGDEGEEDRNPVARPPSAGPAPLATPGGLGQEADGALGAQGGEAGIREVALRGCFTRFRRAAATPYNLIFEARP